MSSSGKRTVVITGCSSGIGEDAAKFLAKKGWVVFAGIRKQTDADKLSSYHSNIRPVFLDVTQQDQIDKAFEQIRSEIGETGLDAVVNNAGGGYPFPIEFIPIDKFKEQFELNYFGVVRVTQAALPLLRLGKPGKVITIGSIAADMSLPFNAPYCGTKIALDVFNICLRREVSKWGIKVVMIKPGPINTPAFKAADNHYKEVLEKFPQDSDCWKLYEEELKRYPEAIGSFEKTAGPVENTTKVIHQALTQKNPRRVMYDSWKTWFSMTMLSWTPESAIDAQLDKLIRP